MSADQILYLVIFALCTLVSGFVSGSETALIGIGKERVHQLEGRRGHHVQQLVDDPERTLATLLVANNVVNVLAAAVATALFITLVGEQWGPWVATAVVAAVLLIFGEITPKTLANRYPEQFALTVSPAIWHLSRFLAPVAGFFGAITSGLLRLFRIPVDGGSVAVTDEDIRALAALGVLEGEIEGVEHEIIDALLDLADRPVREAMTPRIDLVTLQEPVTMEQVRKAVAATGHSRYPVIDGDVDDLLGLLYVKDLLPREVDPNSAEIRGLLRRPHFIPETTSILATLTDMRQRRYAVACIVDEHGGVEGIVTAKDLVAELVGELQDEYDPGVPSVVRIGTRNWVADGRVTVEMLAQEIERSIPEGPYTTVAGLFMAHAGRVPEEGDTVDVDGIGLTVLQMDRNRVDRVDVSAP
jgi:magnesium and cobalt exporter, CNNM family